MRSAATFAEILEAELNCAYVPPGSGGCSRPLTAPLFVFEQPRPEVDSPPFRIAFGHGQPVPQGGATPRREPPTPPTTPLSPLERRALLALNDVGADLGENPSPGALRRAFRQLARRYHPDRHPGASAAEQDRLARVFGEATEHYRVLAAAFHAQAEACARH